MLRFYFAFICLAYANNANAFIPFSTQEVLLYILILISILAILVINNFRFLKRSAIGLILAVIIIFILSCWFFCW